MVKDLICGMDVGEETKFKIEYKGETYYFCSLGCKEEFEKNPQKYVEK
ncbi:MAG: YHS domain-containing protein [Candidatus Bathyarchaeia archaeon]